jgi:hypothetical protein
MTQVLEIRDKLKPVINYGLKDIDFRFNVLPQTIEQ